MSKKQPKPSHVQLPDTTQVVLGGLVSYYRNGWRTGHLAEIINESSVKVRPVSPPNARLALVAVEDLRAAQ